VLFVFVRFDWFPSEALFIPLVLQECKNNFALLWRIVGRQEIGWEEVSNVLSVKEQEYPACVFGGVLEGNSLHIPPSVEWLGTLRAPFADNFFTFIKVLFTVLAFIL
jgi:hypothetical protein